MIKLYPHQIQVLDQTKDLNRVALQMRTAPFGFAAKNKTVWSYHISPKKLKEYIGKECG